MSEYNEKVPFIDLNAQLSKNRTNIDAAIARVLDHGQFIMGPEVKKLETELAAFSGAKYVLSCANGTDALTLALMAFGIGPGDAVFVPAFTYVASAEAPAQLGAVPYFVDVDASSFNICHESLKKAIIEAREQGLNPSVIIAVDLFGQPARATQLSTIAKEQNMRLLIDGAQSFGGSIDNEKVGTFGDITTTSFFPSKPLCCFGDGGAVFTQCEDLADLVNSIRLHGRGLSKYDNIRIGMNSRLDTIQAAVLLEKLKIFPEEIKRRSEIAAAYSAALGDIFTIPHLEQHLVSAWAQYTVRTKGRSEWMDRLNTVGVPSVVYYPKALSQQDGYKHYPIVSTGVNVSERLTDQVMSLPMHPLLDVENVIERILSCS